MVEKAIKDNLPTYDYLDHGRKFFSQNPDKNIFSDAVDGRRVWFKKGGTGKRTFWHALQGLIATAIKKPILSVTAIPDGVNAALQESKNLRKFSELGVRAPDLLAHNDQMLVVSHLGTTFSSLLDQTNDLQERKKFLLIAVQGLSDMHKKGLVHGRPYLRDMILCDDGKTGFIDLEETPLAVMNLPQAQARDVWLFLCSAAKYARNPDNKYNFNTRLMNELFAQYSAHADNDTVQELKTFTGFLMPIANLLQIDFLWRLVGGDARHAVIATKTSSQVFEENI